MFIKNGKKPFIAMDVSEERIFSKPCHVMTKIDWLQTIEGKHILKWIVELKSKLTLRFHERIIENYWWYLIVGIFSNTDFRSSYPFYPLSIDLCHPRIWIYLLENSKNYFSMLQICFFCFMHFCFACTCIFIFHLHACKYFCMQFLKSIFGISLLD